MSERRTSARLKNKAPEESPQPTKERKTTARNGKKGKKEEPPPSPVAPAPVDDEAALLDELLEKLLEMDPSLIETPEETLRSTLKEAVEETFPGIEFADLRGADEATQTAILEAALAKLAPPPSPPVEEAPGSAAAAAQAAASPPPAAPSEDDLLAAAQARAAADKDEEEDTPASQQTSAPSPQQVLSVKVPITGEALRYTVEVKAKSPGPVPMEASQASLSQGAMSEESPLPVPGVLDESLLGVRWYSVTVATPTTVEFPEALGERFNLIFPAHRMAPVSWAAMKRAHAVNGETYYAFTVVEAASSMVLGDYSLETGDPKKVIATGVINVHKNPATGLVTANILDMGTREDKIPKGGAVNPYLANAIKSMAQQLPPNAVIRYSCNQLADTEFLSRRATMHAVGIPLSQWTRTGLDGNELKEAVLKPRGSDHPESISAVKLRPSKTGPARILYDYREEGTGAVKSFDGAAVDRVEFMGATKAIVASRIEFVGLASSVLAEGGEDRDITLPAAVLKDEYKRTQPQRGGRKRTQRKRATSRRSS